MDKTFTDENGTEFNQIVPTLPNKARNIVSRMCDIIGYSRAVQSADGAISTKLYLRGTPRFVAGSRFKYIPNVIDFNYQSLCDAITMSIEKQAEEDGAELFVDSTENNPYTDTTSTLDFDELMKEFSELLASIEGANDTKLETEAGKHFKEYWQPRITQCIEKYLGKGKKLKDANRDQVEALDLIVMELKDIINNK